MWNAIKKDIKSIKYHIFGFLSILIKYIVPVVFVCVKAFNQQTKNVYLQSWGLIIIGVFILIYWFGIRRFLASKKTEENLIRRLDINKASPLTAIGMCIMDDIIFSPVIPLLVYFVTDILQELSMNVSSCFFVVTILFLVGGIFKFIDVIITYSRAYSNE